MTKKKPDHVNAPPTEKSRARYTPQYKIGDTVTVKVSDRQDRQEEDKPTILHSINNQPSLYVWIKRIFTHPLWGRMAEMEITGFVGEDADNDNSVPSWANCEEATEYDV